MNNGLVLLGGGGHCAAIIDSLDKQKFQSVIILDNNTDTKNVSGVPIVGNDSILEELYNQGYRYVFISMNTNHKSELYNTARGIGYSFISIIDKTAVVSQTARIDEGVYIGKNAIINTESDIGKCSIINSGAIVEHHCKVGKFSHIAPGSVLCGTVCVGDNTHIGAASCVRQNLSIGSNTIIGMGSVVTKDVPDNVTSYGNPCRTVKTNE